MEYEPIKGESTAEATTATVQPATQTTTKVTGYATVGKSFTLDGSRSTDDGVVRTFLWKQVSGPTIRIADPKSAKTSFVPSVAGTYVFDLIVTDSAGRSTVSMKVTVTASATLNTTPTTVTAPSGDTSITPVFLEIEPIKGESPDDAQKGGNVEFEWKVEEGEKSQVPGVEPDEIDVADDDSEGAKGGVSVAAGDINGLTEEEKSQFLAQVKLHAQIQSEQDLENFAKGVLLENENMEQISLNFEKISLTHRVKGKLLGFIPISFSQKVEVDTKGDDAGVKVKMPWFTFLMSSEIKASELETELAEGKDHKDWIEVQSFSAQAETISTISNVLKTKHDTAKNSIGNVR